MKTIPAGDFELFKSHGFWFEDFLGCWMINANGCTATIANGESLNGVRYEVQVTTDDGEFVDGSDGDQTAESALAFARAVLEARRVA